jgi:hypothetical protein
MVDSCARRRFLFFSCGRSGAFPHVDKSADRGAPKFRAGESEGISIGSRRQNKKEQIVRSRRKKKIRKKIRTGRLRRTVFRRLAPNVASARASFPDWRAIFC